MNVSGLGKLLPHTTMVVALQMHLVIQLKDTMVQVLESVLLAPAWWSPVGGRYSTKGLWKLWGTSVKETHSFNSYFLSREIMSIFFSQ